MSSTVRLGLAAALATALSASALGAVFDSLAWVPFVWGAIAMVAGGGLLARWLRIPEALAPVGSALGLAAFVVLVFGQGDEIAGVLPTGATVEALREQVRTGFADIERLAAPVPTHRGLLLLTVVGVGLIAVLVDVIAVSLRRAAVAGLPLLALFAVPTAVSRYGVGWLPFVLGGAGFLALLLADGRERVTRWGRPLSPARAAGRDAAPYDVAQVSPLAAVGRRIGAAALGIAVIAPAVVPWTSGGALARAARGSAFGTGDGPRSAQTLNPITELRGQLISPDTRELLRVETRDTDPGYLRMTALDQFNGRGWFQSALRANRDQQVSRGLPKPDPLVDVDSRRIAATVTVKDLASVYLPVYYPARAVDIEKDWRYDGNSQTIFSSRANTQDVESYQLESVGLAPTAGQLRAAPSSIDSPAQAYVSASRGVPDSVLELVADLTAEARTAYDEVLAIQQYFRSPEFTYSTSTQPGTSGNDLVDFLANKQGYCEQYASAMAIMVRAAGIPARVAIGFTKGERKDGYWSITTKNAHSWPEVYFSGIGWLPFEPTPLATGGAAITPAYADPNQAGDTGATRPDVDGSPTDTAASGGEPGSQLGRVDDALGDSDAAALPGDVAAGSETAAPAWRGWAAAAALLGLVAGAAPGLARLATRRRRTSRMGLPGVAGSRAAWQEVLDTAVDAGIPMDVAESPRGTAARLTAAARLPEPAVAALRRVTSAEERARYARTAEADLALAGAVHEVRSGLLTSVGRRARLRAALAPVSTLRAAAAGSATQVANLLDGVDVGLARLRSRLVRRTAHSR